MERHTVIVYMYKVEGEYGGVRILVVYQNRHPKQYYIEWGMEEEGKSVEEKINLSKEKLNNLE